MKKANRT